jgi:predicted PurR-regulated permease PerM
MIKIELSIRNLITIAGVVAGVWLLIRVWDVIVLAGVGLLLAAALMPYVDWLWRRSTNRAAAVTIVMLIVLAFCALVFVIIVPPMIAQGRALWEQAPELQRRAAEFAATRGWQDVAARIEQFQWSDITDRAGPRLVDTSRTVLGAVISLITVFFLAAYFLLDARRLQQFLYFSTPRPWHRHIRALLPALQRVVGGYIRGQAITSGAIFVFSFLVLTVLGVPNALALAAIAAIADLIPLIGVYVLLAPMLLAALSISSTIAIVVVALMVAYQQFEDRVLVPRVYGATLRLPTIAVVLALLVGAELLGLVGALLSLPVAAGARVVVEYFTEVRRRTPEDAADQASPADQAFAPDEEPDSAAVSGRSDRVR